MSGEPQQSDFSKSTRVLKDVGNSRNTRTGIYTTDYQKKWVSLGLYGINFNHGSRKELKMPVSLLDGAPPEILLKDSLIGTFGQREQEIAIMVIIQKCSWCRTWNTPFSEEDFKNSPKNQGTGFAVDGFHELVFNGWIIPTTTPGEYKISPSVVERLKKKRPQAFI